MMKLTGRPNIPINWTAFRTTALIGVILVLAAWGRAGATEQPDPDAAPTDEQVVRDVRGKGKGIIEVKLSDKPGKKIWSSVHKQYFWEKSVVVKRQANLQEVPDATLLVGGLARYEITAGRYRYREFKVTWNEYEGIPRPSDEEALKFVKNHLAELFRGPASLIVHGDKIALEMPGADEQKWVWHTPNSVSFNVRLKYDMAVSNTEVATIDALWEARLYRDKVGQPWKSLMGSERKTTEKERKKFTIKELDALPRGVPQ